MSLRTIGVINGIAWYVGAAKYIEAYCELNGEDKLLGQATGFVFEKNDELYFITNYHVVFGRNPKADKDGIYKPLDSSLAVPNKLRIYYLENGSEPCNIDINLEDENTDLLTIKLSDDEYCDVVIIPLENKCRHLNRYRFPIGAPANIRFVGSTPDYKIDLTNDVFVVGFPFGIGYGHYPIWKRGSIATYPYVNFDGKPCFLVDTVTREGMSGSPVFYVRSEGFMGTDNTPSVDDHGLKTQVYNIKFLGVYSGRIIGNKSTSKDMSQSREERDKLLTDAQLGIVWKEDVIDRIIAQFSKDKTS